MIYELLAEGRENAKTARELADCLNIEPRVISRKVEAERRAGVPICASCGKTPGYFLPKDEQELATYCRHLKRRAIQIFVTRQALVKVLEQIQEKRERDEEQGNQ